MKKRILSTLLILAMLVSLLSGLALTADAAVAWGGTPTGYTTASDVKYSTSGGTVKNWGARGEDCVFLPTYAQNYYTGSYSYSTLSAKSGSSSAASYTSSALYTALRSMVKSKQDSTTSYDGTKSLYCYTDCVNSNSNYISSFYSAAKLNGDWDGSWNREHTWPNSKCSGSLENDIMMLRPTAISENSSRGNTAYGESTGYYNPNSESGSSLDLRGDVARLMLYCYVRWDDQSYMWGQSGVMENVTVLLKWIAEDPVDTWEMGRNDAVQSITGVRNVFVDFPELAWQLFGQSVPTGIVTPSNGGSTCNHAYGAGVQTTAPSCTANGVMTYTCTLCGYKKTESIPALGHTDANNDNVCDVCHVTLSGYTLTASLKDGDKVVIYNPGSGMAMTNTVLSSYYLTGLSVTPTANTLVNPGSDIVWDVKAVTGGFEISNNGNKLSMGDNTYHSIPLNDANTVWSISAATTTDCVYITNTVRNEMLEWYADKGEFSAIGYRDTNESLFAMQLYVLGGTPTCSHNWGTGVVTTAATCTVAGVRTYTCSLCNATKTESIAATGHSWDAGVVTTPATQTTAGVRTYTCSVCKQTKTETIPALGGHTHATVEIPAIAATCTSAGHTAYYSCTCGKYFSDAAATAEITLASTLIAALGHIDVNGDNLCDRCGISLGSVKPVENPFTDIDEESFYYPSVLWAVGAGITTGVDPIHFMPGKNCTRGEVVTFLWRAMGKPEPQSLTTDFKDIDEEAFYYKAVLWAAEEHITNGMDDTHFAPNATVTRGQFVAFLWRAQGRVKPLLKNTGFTDLDKDAFYYNAVLWAVEYCITDGIDNTHFAPNAACNRAQVVTFLYRAIA